MEIDLEKLEDEIDAERFIQSMGYLNLSSFETCRDEAANGLLRFGNSFEQALGTALAIAERTDAVKIMRYFYQNCEQAKIMFKMHQAKQKATTT